jgi:hypothetical protein
MTFGAEILSKGATGVAVAELQIRLAGFRGTVWDGVFGPGTELQVITFQRDYMKMDNPTGIVDEHTYEGLDRFAKEFPIDFNTVVCPDCDCPGKGFGQNRFLNEYASGRPHSEEFYRREYPGIHKAILQTYRAVQFYAKLAEFGVSSLSSGYRCWFDNEEHDRTTTNHMGKALDVDFPLKKGESKRDDCRRCDAVRGLLVQKCNFQIGWGAKNVKALEPSNIAPSWVHMDVRCYERNFLADKYFVKSAEALDSKELEAK